MVSCSFLRGLNLRLVIQCHVSVCDAIDFLTMLSCLSPFLQFIFRPFPRCKNSRAGVSSFPTFKTQFATHHLHPHGSKVTHYYVRDRFLPGVRDSTAVHVLCRLYLGTDEPCSTTHTDWLVRSPMACVFYLITLDRRFLRHALSLLHLRSSLLVFVLADL